MKILDEHLRLTSEIHFILDEKLNAKSTIQKEKQKITENLNESEEETQFLQKCAHFVNLSANINSSLRKVCQLVAKFSGNPIGVDDCATTSVDSRLQKLLEQCFPANQNNRNGESAIPIGQSSPRFAAAGEERQKRAASETPPHANSQHQQHQQQQQSSYELTRLAQQVTQLKAERACIQQECVRLRRVKTQDDKQLAELTNQLQAANDRLNELTVQPTNQNQLCNEAQHHTEDQQQEQKQQQQQHEQQQERRRLEATIAENEAQIEELANEVARAVNESDALRAERESNRLRESVAQVQAGKLHARTIALRSKNDTLHVKLDNLETELDFTVDSIRKMSANHDRERGKWQRELASVRSVLNGRDSKIARLEQLISSMTSLTARVGATTTTATANESSNAIAAVLSEVGQLRRDLQLEQSELSKVRAERQSETEKWRCEMSELQSDNLQLKLKLNYYANAAGKRGNETQTQSAAAAPLLPASSSASSFAAQSANQHQTPPITNKCANCEEMSGKVRSLQLALTNLKTAQAELANEKLAAEKLAADSQLKREQIERGEQHGDAKCKEERGEESEEEERGERESISLDHQNKLVNEEFLRLREQLHHSNEEKELLRNQLIMLQMELTQRSEQHEHEKQTTEISEKELSREAEIAELKRSLFVVTDQLINLRSLLYGQAAPPTSGDVIGGATATTTANQNRQPQPHAYLDNQLFCSDPTLDRLKLLYHQARCNAAIGQSSTANHFVPAGGPSHEAKILLENSTASLHRAHTGCPTRVWTRLLHNLPPGLSQIAAQISARIAASSNSASLLPISSLNSPSFTPLCTLSNWPRLPYRAFIYIYLILIHYYAIACLF